MVAQSVGIDTVYRFITSNNHGMKRMPRETKRTYIIYHNNIADIKGHVLEKPILGPIEHAAVAGPVFICHEGDVTWADRHIKHMPVAVPCDVEASNKLDLDLPMMEARAPPVEMGLPHAS